MHCAGIPAYGVQRANFHQKMKMMNLQYFAFLCIFDGFLNFWWCFLWKAYQTLSPCQNFPLVSQQSVASINNKNPTILTKRLPVATTVPSGTQRHHWALVYWGIPLNLRSRPQQSHHLPGALLSRWLQVVYRVSNGRHSHYLWLYSDKTAKRGVFFWRKLVLWTSN